MLNYTINRNLSWRRLGDHTVILDTSINKQVHHLNETASIIWDGLVSNRTLNEIENLIREEFEDCSNNLQEDIQEIIKDFEDKSLLSID